MNVIFFVVKMASLMVLDYEFLLIVPMFHAYVISSPLMLRIWKNPTGQEIHIFLFMCTHVQN